MSLANHRPRGIGEIVDATFAYYRSNAANVFTVAMIVLVPSAILKAIAPTSLGRLPDVLANLLLPVGQGAIAAMVCAAVERDETSNVGDAFRRAAGRTGSLIAAQFASGLMMLIGLILLVFPAAIAIAWTAVCIPVVMAEEVGYSKAIDRSRALARGRIMYVLGTLLLAWTLALLLMFGASAAARLLVSDSRILTLLMELFFAAVIPIPAIAMTFLYYDLRVKSEGADMDAMMADLPAPALTT